MGNTLRQEIAENERQVDMAQENFEKISRIIRKEFDAFDIKKCQDFKATILQYLEQMLKSQESLVTHWERFLPEIKQMEPWGSKCDKSAVKFDHSSQCCHPAPPPPSILDK